MKVFVFNGSSRAKNSVGYRFFEVLKDKLQEQISLEICWHSASNSEISPCVGCLKCFETGELACKDDMLMIRKEILSSDLIILISPVFFHNVSGQMKSFIDKITSWTHLMRLSGKIGLTVSVSDSNGNKFVNDYLKKVFDYLGIVIIQQVSIESKLLSLDALQSYGIEAARRIAKSVRSNNLSSLITPEQEKIFSTWKNIYSNPSMPNTYETNYWKNNEMIKYDTFKEYYEASSKFICKENNSLSL